MTVCDICENPKKTASRITGKVVASTEDFQEFRLDMCQECYESLLKFVQIIKPYQGSEENNK